VNAGRSALVLGGTGHLGHAILRELMGRGYRVDALTRKARPPILEGLDVRVIQGDADLPETLEAHIEEGGVVVDAAAPYPLHLQVSWRGGPDPVHAAVARTERLVEATERRGASLLFISSFTTLPRPAGVVGDLEARVRRAAHPYFVTKEAMEATVLAACGRGLRGVVVNPTACLGPWDNKPRSLCYLPLLLSGEMPATAVRAVNVVDVRDVARGAVAALEAELYGQPILLAGHDIRADHLSARACQLAGRRPPILRASTRAAATAFYWTEWFFEAMGRRAPFPSLPALLLCEARATGIGDAQRALGVMPRPLDETLRDAIEWYWQLGYLRP
jgi:dihydroflavonol-4-reductase